MKLYRLQTVDGKGCFQTSRVEGLSTAHELISELKGENSTAASRWHPIWYDDRVLKDGWFIGQKLSIGWKFAFGSLGQLGHWFDKEQREVLYMVGLKLYSFEAEKFVIGETQAVFNPISARNWKIIEE